MIHGPKSRVIRRILETVASHVPLEHATVATLGGWGLEATLWSQVGIAPANGWLIERSREGRKKLISDYGFHYCNQLAHFCQLFASVNGSEKGIDLFHLDLCGTFAPSIASFQGILPLVATGDARFIAVTLADQRSIHMDGREEKFSVSAPWFLYKIRDQMDRVSHRINTRESLHGDSGTMADREIQFAAEFVHQLEAEVPRHTIAAMWRFVYHSPIGDQGRRFRMRTYLFQLAPHHTTSFETMLEIWEQSPVYLVTEDVIRVVKNHAKPRRESMPKSNPSFPRLQQIAAAVGGEVKEEFDQLLSLAEIGMKSRAIFEGLQAVHGSKVNGHAVLVSEKKSDDTTRAPKVGFAGEQWGIGVQNLCVQLYLLKQHAESTVGDAKFHGSAFPEAAQFLGVARKKNQCRTIGALYARTQGRFRGSFVKLLLSNSLAEHHDELLQDLATWYGSGVTSGQLRKEAQEYRYRKG